MEDESRNGDQKILYAKEQYLLQKRVIFKIQKTCSYLEWGVVITGDAHNLNNDEQEVSNDSHVSDW